MNLKAITNYITPQKIGNNLKNISDQKITEGILWGVPTAIVPFRQYLDKDRTNGESKELRYRDIITYTAGPASYFAGEIGVSKFLEKTNLKPLKNLGKKAKKAMSIGVGMALFMGWATYGAVNLAKKLVKHDKLKTKENIEENPFKQADFKDSKAEPVEKKESSFVIQTPDEKNPYYVFSINKYSQSFGENDPFKRFRTKISNN